MTTASPMDEYLPMRDPAYRLQQALATVEPHMYRTSASYKAAVDGLAQMLPHMLEGLAREAARQDAVMQEMYTRRLLGPLPTGHSPNFTPRASRDSEAAEKQSAHYVEGVTSWRNQ